MDRRRQPRVAPGCVLLLITASDYFYPFSYVMWNGLVWFDVSFFLSIMTTGFVSYGLFVFYSVRPRLAACSLSLKSLESLATLPGKYLPYKVRMHPKATVAAQGTHHSTLSTASKTIYMQALYARVLQGRQSEAKALAVLAGTIYLQSLSVGACSVHHIGTR